MTLRCVRYPSRKEVGVQRAALRCRSIRLAYQSHPRLPRVLYPSRVSEPPTAATDAEAESHGLGGGGGSGTSGGGAAQ
jgi:hypothetical protein